MGSIASNSNKSTVDSIDLTGGAPWHEKSYVTKLSRFAGGQVEVVTHLINPLQFKRREESVAMGGLLRQKHYLDEPDELTPEQIAQREAKKAAENLDRSARRAKQHVRFGVKAIGADHLLTLTYRTKDDAAMVDLERLKADWKRFCRLVKSGLPKCGKWTAHKGLVDWKFVATKEVQENGSWHLHVAVVGRQDINFLRRCWFVAIGGNQDDSGELTLGNVDVRGPSKRWGSKTNRWRPDKLAGYMTKYIHKTFGIGGEPKNAKRYWSGRSNEKPVVVRYWIAARDFCEAIVQTHSIFRSECHSKGLTIWAADGYQSIWLSG